MKKKWVILALLVAFLGSSVSYKAYRVARHKAICASLKKVPFGDELGIIDKVQQIEVEGAYAPLNGSLVSDGEGFLLFFRYDVKDRVHVAGVKLPIRKKVPFPAKKMPFRTFIGVIRLDKDFKQITPVKTLNTGTEFAEDPRAFKTGEKLYVSYSDMVENEVYGRTIRLAEIDADTLEMKSTLDIDQLIHHVDQPNHMEKNWVPFVNQEGEIFFEYGLNPHKVMRMQTPSSPQMDHLIFPHRFALQKMPWDVTKWGAFRGGTPAIAIDENQYLAFFHTLFFEDRRPWYVMGAYTFETKAPYRVTAVSSAPILFKGIFGTHKKNTASSTKRVIYPAGIALGEKEGRPVVFISCGENDSGLKILTFDQEKLLQSLTPVPLSDL